MKKEVLITVYDMDIGGIERSLINMLECFDYDRIKVSLLVCSHKGDFMELIPRQVNLLPEMRAYTVFRKPLIRSLREGHYLATLFRLQAKLIANAKARRRKLEEGSGYIQMQLESKYFSRLAPPLKGEYDLAISYAWPHDIVLRNVRAKRKIAWIHTDYTKLEIDNELDLAGWNKFERIVSISDACTDSFLTRYPQLKPKMMKVENITSPDFVRSLAEEETAEQVMDSSDYNIVSVGRLSYVKGFDMAVKALKMVRDKGMIEVKWYVVGYGGYETELRQLIEQHGLTDSFVLLGKQSNPYPYIRQCDLFVQPSRYEGKAVTVTEAQILGKPIVITNYPTSSSQVTNEVDGVICPISPEGIAAAIERLYMDRELADRLAAYLRGRSYSNREELDKLYELMKD